MTLRIPSIPEPFRMLLVGVCTVIVIIAGKRWPNLEVAIWVLFLGALCVPLYFDLRRPVNYESLQISDATIFYAAAGTTTEIRLSEIVKLEFAREQALFDDLYGPYIESKWLVRTNSHWLEIMDELPHRRQLLRAFQEHLPGFDSKAARAGMAASGEGKWLCYEASFNDSSAA